MLHTHHQQRSTPRHPEVKRLVVHFLDVGGFKRFPFGMGMALATDLHLFFCDVNNPFKAVKGLRFFAEFFAPEVAAPEVAATEVAAPEVAAAPLKDSVIIKNNIFVFGVGIEQPLRTAY